MTTFNTCRFCDNWKDQNMVRFGPRHYTHPQCWLDRDRDIAELPWHVIEQFPYRLLQQNGLLSRARSLIEAKNSPKSARQKRIDKIFAASTNP